MYATRVALRAALPGVSGLEDIRNGGDRYRHRSCLSKSHYAQHQYGLNNKFESKLSCPKEKFRKTEILCFWGGGVKCIKMFLDPLFPSRNGSGFSWWFSAGFSPQNFGTKGFWPNTPKSLSAIELACPRQGALWDLIEFFLPE